MTAWKHGPPPAPGIWWVEVEDEAIHVVEVYLDWDEELAFVRLGSGEKHRIETVSSHAPATPPS